MARQDLWQTPDGELEWREPAPPKGAYRINVTPDEAETAPQTRQGTPEASEEQQASPETAARIRELAARLAGGDRSVRDELAQLMAESRPKPAPMAAPEPKQSRDPDGPEWTWHRIEEGF